MNSTTPKGINYAKLRKQRLNQDTLPKSMSSNVKMDIHSTQQFGKHRSTSQHTISEMTQIQLFDQYLTKPTNQNEFLAFIDKQMQYFQQTTPVLFRYMQQNFASFRVTSKKIQDEKKKIQHELQKYNSENTQLIREIRDLNKAKVNLQKRYEVLQSLILKERIMNQSRVNYKYQISPAQETISSLTDERFESNETSLDSSLSDEDEQSQTQQLFELLQKNSKHRFNFQKQIA